LVVGGHGGADLAHGGADLAHSYCLKHIIVEDTGQFVFSLNVVSLFVCLWARSFLFTVPCRSLERQLLLLLLLLLPLPPSVGCR
jgi:hypothetical protein